MRELLDFFRPDCRECFLIAEVAQTHDGSLGQAHAFVDAVADAGADAIKFQTHIADAESTPGEPWRLKFSRQDETRYDYWRRMEFTEPQWRGLAEHARERDLHFLSSAFSFEAFELLERLGMQAWKVASGELTNLPMLERMASTRKPVILSSGLSDWDDITRAVDTVRRAGAPVALLQATTSYPTPPEKLGLNVIGELRERYGIPVGLSDHSGTLYAGLAAHALGARFLEVHVTLSPYMFGPDVSSSIRIEQLADLANGLRFLGRAFAHPVDKKSIAEEMAPLRSIFQKSVVARTDIPAGTVLRREHLTLKKPGTGVPPAQLESLIGKRLTRPLKADEQIRVEHLSD